MKKEEVKFYKFPDDFITVRIYADEFWEELANLLEDKYGFTVDDIVFSDWGTHCECCGRKLNAKEYRGLSRFTNEFMDFCFTVGQRRLEVEKRNSERDPFNCPECGRRYKTERGFVRHMETKHDCSKPSHWTKDEYVQWLLENPSEVEE